MPELGVWRIATENCCCGAPNLLRLDKNHNLCRHMRSVAVQSLWTHSLLKHGLLAGDSFLPMIRFWNFTLLVYTSEIFLGFLISSWFAFQLNWELFGGNASRMCSNRGIVIWACVWKSLLMTRETQCCWQTWVYKVHEHLDKEAWDICYDKGQEVLLQICVYPWAMIQKKHNLFENCSDLYALQFLFHILGRDSLWGIT